MLGTTQPVAKEAVMRTGLGRGEGLDLDVGAVDELLVGECEVWARDKEEKTSRWLLSWLLGSPLFIITNSIY